MATTTSLSSLFVASSSINNMTTTNISTTNKGVVNIEHVLKLNSKGAKLLQAQRYGKAATVLTTCLASMKELLASSQARQMERRTVIADDHPAFVFRFPATRTSRHDQDASTASRHQAPYDSDSFCTPPEQRSFDSPMKIVLNDTLSVQKQSRASLSFRSLSMVSFAILYNLGLAFHLGALEKYSVDDTSTSGTEAHSTRRTLQRRLEKALALYETAASLMTARHDSSTALRWNLLERLALGNNRGHVHQMLGHDPQARDCHQAVLARLVWSTTPSSTNSIQTENNPRRLFPFDLFFDNAIGYVLAPSQSAEAA